MKEGDGAQRQDQTVVSEAQGPATGVGAAMPAATRVEACVEGERGWGRGEMGARLGMEIGSSDWAFDSP